MNHILPGLIGFIIGLIIFGALSILRARSSGKRERAMMEAATALEIRARVAEDRVLLTEESLKREREEHDRQLANLKDAFRGLSSEVLKESRDEFLKQAHPKINEYIRPLQESLTRYEVAIRDIEGKRNEAYGGIIKGIEQLVGTNERLQHMTSVLSTALRNPSARGRWGEITLKRVIEVAGMSQYCDFDLQVSAEGENGRQRPDVVVRLPGNRQVVIDAKAPLDAYMEAQGCQDENRRAELLALHAQAVRKHMRDLGLKNYWEQFSPAPDFVVLFLPGESFFSAALESDRALIEDGLKSRVILATPTTLIALLRSVAMGWQQEQLAENAALISEAGKDLFERCVKFASHLGGIKKGLEGAVGSFNEAIGSWDKRVLPGARRLKDLGAAKSESHDVQDIPMIEQSVREVPVCSSERSEVEA